MSDLYLNLDVTPASVTVGRNSSQAFRLYGKRGEAVALRVYFLEKGDFITPDVVNLNLELKCYGHFDETATVRGVSTTIANDGSQDYVELSLDLTGSELDAILNPSNSDTKYNAIFAAEVSWENAAGDVRSTRTFAAEILNDVVKTLEATAIPSP